MEGWDGQVLEGQGVRLEPLARSHLDGLWAASRDPRIWRFLSVLQPQTPSELADLVEDALARSREGVEVPFATVSRETGSVLGSTRFLALRSEHHSVEIGWTWLSSAAWGTGVNAEAKLLQFEHAFERWRCRRVELKTDALNEPARRSLEAFGAVFEGIHRKHMLVRNGENRDTAWYSVVDDEWPRVRARLARQVRAHTPARSA
jgi:RimJ/RimL family protein N-acetyltransferase